jgi:putative ATPase
VDQQYLPDAVADEVFYEPTNNGYEEKIRENFERIGRRKGSN